ncbi:MAG: hypothetical protein JKY50_04735 [Oleispira sp.]|nr:hypothetical protein [Oleispira sp.]
MLNNMKKTLLAVSITSALVITQGCALSPQVIPLDTRSNLHVMEPVSGRTALVRVQDQREFSDRLGNRGGAVPEEAPLIAQPTLQQALTEKMQASLQTFGFGGSSPMEPVKVEIIVNEFQYQCNEGDWVNQCQLDIELRLNIENSGKKFSQPFKLNEQRSVTIAPQTEYNTLWINQSIDKLWQHMFTKPQVMNALGIM